MRRYINLLQSVCANGDIGECCYTRIVCCGGLINTLSAVRRSEQTELYAGNKAVISGLSDLKAAFAQSVVEIDFCCFTAYYCYGLGGLRFIEGAIVLGYRVRSGIEHFNAYIAIGVGRLVNTEVSATESKTYSGDFSIL